MTAEIIFKTFPNLTETQRKQIEALDALYRDWNAKINVISRKDIDNLFVHHVLHSFGIAKVFEFTSGSSILDVGTGGGFPGIPLAILFPECQFVLEDSIGKKIRLKNVEAVHRNVIEEKRKFDFVVSRAVMNTADLAKLVEKNVSKTQRNSLKNGLICLKGGDLTEELKPFGNRVKIWNLSDFFADEFFETKKVTYLPF